MKSICYLNIDLYHYFIGRADQSVNINNIVKRYEMQLRVMRCLVDSYTWDEIKKDAQGIKEVYVAFIAGYTYDRNVLYMCSVL